MGPPPGTVEKTCTARARHFLGGCGCRHPGGAAQETVPIRCKSLQTAGGVAARLFLRIAPWPRGGGGEHLSPLQPPRGVLGGPQDPRPLVGLPAP
eukprot:9764171-Alexandrium_andersonii.AAC.1